MNDADDIRGFERVLITGGTGFIGSALTERLLRLGVGVTVLSRDRDRARDHFQGRVASLQSLDEIGEQSAPRVIVNLAGKNLGEERWNPRVKQALVDSRVDTTQRVIDYIARAEQRPKLLLSGSAVGYYGARGDEPLEEDAAPGDEFQSSLCQRWEQCALQAEAYGVRVCLSRAGVVLKRDGGALAGLLPLFRLGLGAVANGGRQWLAWIHMQDLLDIFIRLMRDEALSGAFNNTAPYPVTNREFAEAIGSVLGRPVLLRSPGWAMRLLYGEMAHLYLTGQKVIPARHRRSGFEYRYPTISAALRAELG